jgi:branched-chain amino acid transport system permease protein
VDFWAVLLIEIAYGVASLALISIGLAIIFGMMRVINFAHGEFLMMGGYAVILLTQAGANLWVAMLLIAPAVVGAIGVLVELAIIRWLYGRMIETLLATWGLSFFLIGLATTLFGNTTRGLSAPLGSLAIGQYRTGMYEVFVIGIAIAVSFVTFAVLRYTRVGLIARGTMQNATMASALGVATPIVYTITFGVGAALSGLAGAVLAPLSGVLPTMGLAYVAKAFIVVITGGAGIISGTATSSVLLGIINQLATYATQPIVGEVALLAAAIILLRLMPQGITGRFFRKGL